MYAVLDGVEGCPTWLMPNRGGRGFYRWRLDETRLDRLTSVMNSALDSGERLAVADSLVAGVAAGGANLAAFFARLPQLVKSNERYLLMSPIPFWRAVQTYMLDDAGRAASRARMRELYGPVLADLAKRGITSDEDHLMEAALVNLLATDARDPKLRADMTARAIAYTGFGTDGQVHRDKLDINLVNTALRVAAQDADPKFAVDLSERLKDTQDPVLRYALLSAVGYANDPALAQRLALDDSIRGDDYMDLLGSMFNAEQAERHWTWFVANIDALLDKAPTFYRDGLIRVAGSFCSDDRAAAVKALFEPRLTKIEGGPRVLDQAIERTELCVAQRSAYTQQARELFH
jgi:alanyl aminopeptidase